MKLYIVFTNILDSILQRKWLIVQKQITKCGMIL